MATLQELHLTIDAGMTVVLFLADNDPMNTEKRNLKIFISREPDGRYRRKLSYVGDTFGSPSADYFTWGSIMNIESAPIEATSNQWEIYSKSEG